MTISDLDHNLRVKLIRFLSEYITPHKREKFVQVLDQRTRFLTVVMEDIYQSQNASAVMRTCECLGIQEIHVIENKNQYELNPDVLVGSSKWVDVIHHNGKKNNTLSCFEKLKDQGYKIIATTPHENDCDLTDLHLDQKTAFVFGTEKDGVSETVLQHADAFVKIPMHGFTESYNISVSAAIVLFHSSTLMRSENLNWKLSEEEKSELHLKWIRSVIKKCEVLESEFFTNRG